MKFKDDIIAARFEDMHPICQKLAVEMDEWSVTNYGTELTLTATTSTLEEDKKLGRVSATHREGRAFDVRTHNLSEEHIHDFLLYFKNKYNHKLGAVTGSGPNLIVYKPHGTGPHFHVQIRRGLKTNIKPKSKAKS